MKHRLRTFIGSAVLAAGLAAIAVPSSGGAAAASTTAADATVTVVHGIPNTPVDVYVNGTDVLPNFTFGTVSPALSLPPGTYAVAVKAAGTSTTLLSASETLTADENATIVANLDASGSPTLTAFANPTTPAPAGDAWVLVRHTAEAPAVDVYAGSTKVVTDLTNPNSAGPLAVPAGTVPVSVDVNPSTSTTKPVIGPVNLALAAGHVYIAYAIGSATASPSTLTAVVQDYTVGQTSGAPSTAGDATVTVVHGIPNTPVDVYVNGTDVLPDFKFGTVSPALSLPAGTYDVAVDAAGTSTTLLKATETLTADENATIVANLDAWGNPTLTVFANPTTPAPAGDAWVLVRHTAEAPAVDVYAGSTKVVTDLTNPNSAGPLAVPAGTVPFSVDVNPSTSAATPVIGPVNLALTPGHVYIAYAIGSATASPSTLTAVVQDYTVGQVKSGGGYRVVTSQGKVACFGSEVCAGDLAGSHLNAPIVGTASTPDGKGYWLVGSDGGVFSFGDAAFYGSEGGTHLNAPIVGIAATADDKGYWLVGSDGGVFSFGDAAFYGSEGGTHLNAPIVGIASTPDGKGYWLVGSDGGVFSFGDAAFYGSQGGTHLNAPVAGIAATADGNGYWLVGTDGGVFSFGDAAFYGSEGGTHLNAPIVGIAATGSSGGYLLGGADGGVFSFGDAAFYGSAAGTLGSGGVGISS